MRHMEAAVLGWVGVDEGDERRRVSNELTAMRMIRNVKDGLYEVSHINKKISLESDLRSSLWRGPW